LVADAVLHHQSGAKATTAFRAMGNPVRVGKRAGAFPQKNARFQIRLSF
jgi:hypothetical protein